MPHSASTDTRTENIINRLVSSTCRGQVNLQVYHDGYWLDINDFDERTGVKWSTSGKRQNIASFGRTPLPAEISFAVLNKNGKWSEGSGGYHSGIITNGSKLRLRAGYIFPDTAVMSENLVLNRYEKAFFFHMKYLSGAIVPDATNTSNTENYFNDFFTANYDSDFYDSLQLSAAGYTVQTHDSLRSGNVEYTGFKITATSTKGKVFYRCLDTLPGQGSTSGAWTSTGDTVNGIKTVTFTAIKKRYLQVAILADGVDWSTDFSITNIEVNYNSYVEYIYTGVFYVDNVSENEPSNSEIPVMSVTGRDLYKRAIDTDYNLPDVNGKTIDEIIKLICDDIKIEYTATSIIDLSSFATRTLTTGNGIAEQIKADQIFDWLMEIINQSAVTKYQMYLDYDTVKDDMVLFVQPRPTVIEASWVMSYKQYESLGGKVRNFDKLLQRVTVLSDSQIPEKTETLDTQTYTTAGTKTLSWSGDAQFKRYTVVTNSGSATVTLSDVTNTSVVFSVTGTTFNITIKVSGDKWSTPPSYEGEYINHSNMVNQKGFTATRENPLIISDAEARLIAKGYIEDYGEPKEEANNLKWPYMNLIPAMNDQTLLWSRSTFVNRLFYIVAVKHTWKATGDESEFSLEDSGKTFDELGSFRYDDVMKYDMGYLYDMDSGVLVDKDETDYNYLKPVRFS